MFFFIVTLYINYEGCDVDLKLKDEGTVSYFIFQLPCRHATQSGPLFFRISSHFFESTH